jgi:hypothetical protein
MVPSIKPIPDAMIAAANTHGPELRSQGDSDLPDFITPSSHGGLECRAIL